MSWSDKIIAFFGLIGLITFTAVILIWVAEPDLIILASIGLILAAYDFWRNVFSKFGDKLVAFAVFLVGLMICSYAVLDLVANFLIGSENALPVGLSLLVGLIGLILSAASEMLFRQRGK